MIRPKTIKCFHLIRLLLTILQNMDILFVFYLKLLYTWQLSYVIIFGDYTLKTSKHSVTKYA